MNLHTRVGLFPGTFDPVTNGHMDVVHRSQFLFDRLIIAIGDNLAKPKLFSVQERLEMIQQLITETCDDHVSVATYTGLTVDYARSVQASAILRGLRNVTDMNFEFQLALTNRAVADIETVFIMTGDSNAFTSSTLIREVAVGGDVERLHRLIPPLVLEKIKGKKQQFGGKFSSLLKDGFTE